MGILEMNAAMTIANQCNSKNNEKLDTLEKEKFLHEIAIEAKVFFNSIKKEEKIISKMLNQVLFYFFIYKILKYINNLIINYFNIIKYLIILCAFIYFFIYN